MPPGLVYQFCLHADGRASFAYLSDGCQALGLSPAQLHARPELFCAAELILADDRASYLGSCPGCQRPVELELEGRIWVDTGKA